MDESTAAHRKVKQVKLQLFVKAFTMDACHRCTTHPLFCGLLFAYSHFGNPVSSVYFERGRGTEEVIGGYHRPMSKNIKKAKSCRVGAAADHNVLNIKRHTVYTHTSLQSHGEKVSHTVNHR